MTMLHRSLFNTQRFIRQVVPTDRTMRGLAWVLCAWLGLSVGLARADACVEDGETHLWISPRSPQAFEPIKIIGVSTDGDVTEVKLLDSEGKQVKPFASHRRNGPPASHVADWDGLRAGGYQAVAARDGKQVACRRFDIGGSDSQAINMVWGRNSEALYSAWFEELFGAPPAENLSFPSLLPVLRNSERNFLYNYLGLHEDDNLLLTPDCADLPYTLRAYFAWKMALPFAFRACNRGSSTAPPYCGAATVKTEFTQGNSSQAAFRTISKQLADAVHSGSARTGLENDATDLYPVSLSKDALWPGTVFADPYGHVLVLAEWVPQTADHPGMLLAVDAQPDNTITRKRFWEGTFLFAENAGAGPGFKAFRPLVNTAAGGWRTLSNNELIDHPGFAPFSLEQEYLSSDDFYAKVGQLVNPRGLDPKQAYDATVDALMEQLQTRVSSVDNGEAYYRAHPGGVIPMPSGAAIFQTVGPWEDYSTPSRDMRLIIAINVLQGLPDKIVRHPELFVLNGKSPAQAKAEIEVYAAKRMGELSIDYTRSDGSAWTLPLAEVLARKQAYEMTYNPNDCVEARWGAEPGGEEYATCRRHAPGDQRAKMEQYRPWFREARRPI